MDANQRTYTDRDAASSASERNALNKPVWLRIPEAVRTRGIGRSTLYALIAQGRVRTRLIKVRRDSLRGIRLVSADSLDDLIEQEGQSDA